MSSRQSIPTYALTGTAPNELIRDRIVLVGDLTDDGGDQLPNAVRRAHASGNAACDDGLERTAIRFRDPPRHGSAPPNSQSCSDHRRHHLLIAPTLTANRAAVSLLLVVVGVLMAIEAYLLFAHGVWLQLVTATLFAALGIGSVQALNSLRAPGRRRAGEPGSGRCRRDGGATRSTKDEDELDLAFSVLRQQGNSDETKNHLYEIAMKHGKRREFAKAERVLTYIQSLDADYRDVTQKLDALSGARASAPG